MESNSSASRFTLLIISCSIGIFLIIIILFQDQTISWFSEDLPSPAQVSAWSDDDIDKNLFKLSRWESFLGAAQFRRFVHNQILGLNLSSKDKFEYLEVGIGVGAFSREILRMFPAATGHGIDIVPGAIAIASVILPHNRINVSVGNMRKLPFKNQAFDVVFVPGALCYLHTTSEVQQAVTEFSRVLRNSGGMCLSMLASNASDMGSCNVRIPKEYWHDVWHKTKLKVVSMDEMDSWNLPHSYGRYSTCLRKQDF